jgi:hypothetical protein
MALIPEKMENVNKKNGRETTNIPERSNVGGRERDVTGSLLCLLSRYHFCPTDHGDVSGFTPN